MSDETITDAVVIDDETTTIEVTTTDTAGTAVVPATPTAALRPLGTPEENGEIMREYQRTLAAILDDTDYQQAERGKKFVKKSGWRKIGKAYGVSLVIVERTVERDDTGKPLRASVLVRATAPNGQTQDGDGYASADEPNYARRRDHSKLENDLRATATTRAKNRAISDLVGMGEVSAEEIAAMGAHEPEPEPPMADDRIIEDIVKPLAALIGDDTAGKVIEWVKARHAGHIPASVGIGMAAVAKASSRHECTPDRDPMPRAEGNA